MAELLERRGFHVETLMGSRARKAEVEHAMQRVGQSAQPGDAVVFYFAGHGYHGWDPEHPEEVHALLLPMDAWESTRAEPRALLGIDLERWSVEIARAIASEGNANITMILDCCHAAGLVASQGVDVEARDIILEKVGKLLQECARRRRRAIRAKSDVEGQVVRVVASDVFSKAYGDGPGTVGAVTRELTMLLTEFPDEPWQAIEHRLRTRIHRGQPNQWPGVEGRRSRVPFTTLDRWLPDGTLPCVFDGAGRWQCDLGGLLGARSGAVYKITDDLAVPGGELAILDGDRRSLRALSATAAEAGTMRWALPTGCHDHMQILLRCVRRSGLSESLRRELMTRNILLLENDNIMRGVKGITIENRGDGFALRDGLGDTTVYWVREPSIDLLLPWLWRLSELDQWLAKCHQPASTPKDTFELSWGVRGDPECLQEGCSIPEGTQLWVELKNTGREPRLYLTVFRVRCDRSVSHLTRSAAGGVPCTVHRSARVGFDDSFVLSLPEGEKLSRSVSEALVAFVSIRPLPLHLAERAPLPRAPGVHGTVATVAMVVSRYQLVPQGTRLTRRAHIGEQRSDSGPLG